MLTRTIVIGFAIVLACTATPAYAQGAREVRAAAPETSFWSWPAVSAFGGISRLWLGNWACSGAYADGPTLENCGAVTSVPARRKRLADDRNNDSTD